MNKYDWENISVGKLKIFYVLTCLLILGAIVILIYVSIFRIFKPKMLFLLGPTAMLIFYAGQIKNAINKNNSNSDNN